MSLYTFAEANLTTPADRRRRPAIDQGQLVRTLILFAIVAIAMAAAAYRDHAGSGVAGPVASMTEAADAAG